MQQHGRKSLLRQILRSYNIELEICRDQRTFQTNLSLVNQIESFIDRHTPKLPSDYLLSFWFQLANIHFMRRDFARSIGFINKILNGRFPNTRVDLQVHARMMNMMIHLEEDNVFVLRYFVDSTRRFLKKVKQEGVFELQMLRFFSGIANLPKFDRKDKFIEFHRQLFVSPILPVPDAVLDYIDYKAWLEATTKRI